MARKNATSRSEENREDKVLEKLTDWKSPTDIKTLIDEETLADTKTLADIETLTNEKTITDRQKKAQEIKKDKDGKPGTSKVKPKIQKLLRSCKKTAKKIAAIVAGSIALPFVFIGGGVVVTLGIVWNVAKIVIRCAVGCVVLPFELCLAGGLCLIIAIGACFG